MLKHEKHLAAIDIGTNSFHLIVAKVNEDGSFDIIDREKEVIRLGEGSSGDIKKIKPDAMQRAENALKRFKGIADSHNADIRAVATSAVRESTNKEEFMKMADNLNVEVEVVSGIEEARLIYLGMLKAAPVFDKRVLCVDIGGGSTEFLLGEKGQVLYANSLKLGAVRLTQMFFPDYQIKKSLIKVCKNWVEGTIYPVAREIKKLGFEECIGSSGTILSAGNMAVTRREETSLTGSILNNAFISKDEVNKIAEEILKTKSLEDRKNIKGLDEKRADIIPAGVIILQTIFEQFEIEEIRLSDYALREGIIIDSLQKLDYEVKNSHFIDIRHQSVNQLASSCNYDHEHCRHVGRLALQLFDELKPVHQLEEKTKEYLEAAAVLHDIGYHISHSKHHKHSNYIIRNSELMGFNENEINVIANVARYHRKSHPKKSHDEYWRMNEKQKELIRKLSAILRIADAFDRTHYKMIKNIKANVTNGTVELDLNLQNGNPEIELWNFERRKGLFEDVFEKKIKLKK